ncbi:hypothetical protein RKE29_02150 [Streptomyces sp. B1866]|uniref:hypothetical protein n=1 Tax=Streptomyces sp. B1866 TaxID=3075431 RepID=UPI00288FC745|nr:hypothetical protein [Streptomyces sp. B1866]MDT3395463.1 hypothetical protein [Streptomyces sp. B1866]
MDCQLCEREQRSDQAEHYLCPGCTAGTARRLARMPGLYAVLAAFLAPGRTRPEHGGTRPAEAPLPVSETALSLRGPGGIVGVLEDWRAAMQADRGWGPPAVAGTAENRVRAAARGLAMNLDWIAQQWPAAGEFAAEMRELERSVLSVVDPAPPGERARRLGYCPVETVEGRCGAVVLLRPGQSAARCEWCGGEWGPDRWLALARAQAAVTPPAPQAGSAVSAVADVPEGHPSHA